MHALALWRWVTLRLVQNPLVGALCAILLAGCPLLWSFRILPTSDGILELAWPWCLPAGLLGAALGLATLSADQAFLARLAPRDRWAGELGAVTLAGLFLQLPILAGALLCGAVPSDLGPSLPAILTTDLYLAALAQLLLLSPVSTATRVSLLLAAVWVVPCLAVACGGLERALALLDAGRALRTSAPAQCLPALSLALSLTLVSYLLRMPGPRGDRA